ncbi:ammonium transporter [Lacticaseibacillus camelliae]|uniref:ammonium transporter n=1 Tax=Lacticaseibacillus camelliae TaxID=381742 RepID=UPI000A475468
MNGANTAFIIVASVLVWFMTPGLAFYYGGLVSKRNVVNTMLSVFYITGLAIILWLLIGYELSFGTDIGGVIGRVRGLFMNGVNLTKVGASGLPQGAYALFQMMFAIITPALFIGAVVGRIRFRFLTWFIVLWSLLVYYPLVHLIWSPAGLLTHLHVVDFAGGTVIHVNAGVTALVLCAFFRRAQRQAGATL